MTAAFSMAWARSLLLCLLLLWPTAGAADPRSPGEQRPRRQVVPRWPQRPDPPPLVTRDYLELTLRLERGQPSLRQAARGSFPRAQAIAPRFDGRYAIELYAGQALLDVLRFDFPLAASVGDPDRAGLLPLAAGVSAQTTVIVPRDDRITRALLRDTKTRASYPLKLTLGQAAGAAPAAGRPLRLGTFAPPDQALAPAGPAPGPGPTSPRTRSRR